MSDPISDFERLCAQVAATVDAAQQQALVAAFVSSHPTSPLVSAEQAIIYYTGSAESIVVRGDMLDERSEPLQRLAQTALWFYRGRYEPDARLDYHLLVDSVDIGDPRNPRQVPNGYGPRAELRMPEYGASQVWQPQPGMPTGTIHTFEQVASAVYPTTRTVWVYTPAGYDPQRRYPSVYFQDGGDYLNFGSAQAVFDNLIAAGALPPCIAVFIDPSREHGRQIDYDLNHDYCRFVSEELVAWVDQRYATERGPSRRAIVGASFGGLIALCAAALRPDVFGLVVSQSGFLGRSAGAIKQMYAQPAPIAAHVIIGTYETSIGVPDSSPVEADFLRANREFRELLAAQRYRYAYAEYHEGHSWGLWRARLGDGLMFLLNP